MNAQHEGILEDDEARLAVLAKAKEGVSSARAVSQDEPLWYRRQNLMTASEVRVLTGISRRTLSRESKKPNSKLPRRGKHGRHVLYSRTDVLAFHNERIHKELVKQLDGTVPSAICHVVLLLDDGYRLDEAAVQLGLGCNDALRSFVDWSEERAACAERNIVGDYVERLGRRDVNVRGLVSPQQDEREDALISLATTATMMERMRWELEIHRHALALEPPDLRSGTNRAS